MLASKNSANAGPGDSQQTLELDMSEVNIKALTTALHIAHANFDHFPKKVTLTELCEIVIAAKEYDLSKCIRSLAHQWYMDMPPVNLGPLHLNPGTLMRAVRRMWLSNHLGSGGSGLHYKLIQVAHVDEDGDLTYPRAYKDDKPCKIKNACPLVDLSCMSKSLAFPAIQLAPSSHHSQQRSRC